MKNLILSTVPILTLVSSLAWAHPFEKCPDLSGSYKGIEDGQQPAEGPNKFEDSIPVKLELKQSSTQLTVTVTAKGKGGATETNQYTLNRATTTVDNKFIRIDSASCFGNKIVVTSTFTPKSASNSDPDLLTVSSKIYEKTRAGKLKFSEVTVRANEVLNRILIIAKP